MTLNLTKHVYKTILRKTTLKLTKKNKKLLYKEKSTIAKLFFSNENRKKVQMQDKNFLNLQKLLHKKNLKDSFTPLQTLLN